jgi:LysM repeat protein
VGPGDSLWSIARKKLGAGARYPEILALNGLKSEMLQDGQKLKLPSASAGPGAGSKLKQQGSREFPKRVNHAFAEGERLTFAVQYFNVTAGYATLSITETVTESGRPCLHILALAKTHPFFETFFKVQDRIDSYIDKDALISWAYEKHLHEGGYKADASYVYDQRAHLMLEPAKGKQVAIAPDTQDVLSCFYWFRNLDMTVGSHSSIPVADDMMKTYVLGVDVLKKERVSTLAGDFDCVEVQPHLQSDGVFQQKGEVYIWLTDDARRIPVKIRSKIAIGSININLQDAQWVQPPN